MRNIEIIQRDVQIAQLSTQKATLESENFGLRALLAAKRAEEFAGQRATFEMELGEAKRQAAAPPEPILASAPLAIDVPSAAN